MHARLKSAVSARSDAWKAWLAAALWLGLIALESTNFLSAANTGQFLYPLLHFLFGLDLVHFLTWHFFLRKTGHVIGYAVLSLLFYRAWKTTIPVIGDPPWSIVWARIAFTMTALVASLDEWHQTFLPSRTGTVNDILLDSSAGLAVQILIFAWMHSLGRRPQARAQLSSPGTMSKKTASTD